MSNSALRWLWEKGQKLEAIRELRGSGIAVVSFIADKTNNDGEFWWQQEDIATHTCVSERFVRTVLRVLERLGLARAEKRGRSRMYHILFHQKADKPARGAGNGQHKPARGAGNGATTPARDDRDTGTGRPKHRHRVPPKPNIPKDTLRGANAAAARMPPVEARATAANVVELRPPPPTPQQQQRSLDAAAEAIAALTASAKAKEAVGGIYNQREYKDRHAGFDPENPRF